MQRQKKFEKHWQSAIDRQLISHALDRNIAHPTTSAAHIQKVVYTNY